MRSLFTTKSAVTKIVTLVGRIGWLLFLSEYNSYYNFEEVNSFEKAHICYPCYQCCSHCRIGTISLPIGPCPLHSTKLAIGLIATVLDRETVLSVALYTPARCHWFTRFAGGGLDFTF